ncbi:MAG: phosphoribosylglycinamide formyltransferase [Thermoleophilaceae bacterium]|nr:phosphoribosylglycinamide formyltransferase [Thermoleophilaceae bacterium]
MPARRAAPALRGLGAARPGRRLLRRVRAGAGRGTRAAARAGGRADRRPRRGDHLRRAHRPAGGRSHHLRGDPPRGAHQEDPAQLLRRAARVRELGAHAQGGHPRAHRRADRAAAADDHGRRVSEAARPAHGVSLRVAVLVSGEGTNLQAILDKVHGREGIEVVGVASSRAGARGLERARAAGVETAVFAAADHPDREARDLALADWLDERGAELVVLAGFMEILTGEFIRRFSGRIVNVHPSLLPAFPGVRSIERAVDHGVRVTGVTVHFVDEGVDTGPIILQRAVPLSYPARIEEIEDRIHAVEHELLPQAVRLIAQGRVRIDPVNHRRVLIEGEGGDGDG